MAAGDPAIFISAENSGAAYGVPPREYRRGARAARALSELGFCHCAKALSVAWCRFPATLSPDYRHPRGSFRAISDPANAGGAVGAELWARTHETARASRRGKRLIESASLQCKSLSATSANQIGTRGALTVVMCSAEQKLAKHSRSWRCRRSAAEQRQLSVWWGLLFTDIRATPDQPQQVRQSHGAALIAVNVENVDPQARLATTSLRTMSRPSCSALAKRRAVPGQSSTLARHRETLCEDLQS